MNYQERKQARIDYYKEKAHTKRFDFSISVRVPAEHAKLFVPELMLFLSQKGCDDVVFKKGSKPARIISLKDYKALGISKESKDR